MARAAWAPLLAGEEVEAPAAAVAVVVADPPEPKPLYTVPVAADPVAVADMVELVVVTLTRVGSCAPQGWS